MSRLLMMLLVWALTITSAWAEEGEPEPQCREGVYGTWRPYDTRPGAMYGSIKVEKDRIWLEKEGGWVDMTPKKTDKGVLYFKAKLYANSQPGYAIDFYFTFFNPVKLDRFRSIPCAVDLVVCEEESWIGAEIENKTGEHIDGVYPIGEIYCGHDAYLPYEGPEIVK